MEVQHHHGVGVEAGLRLQRQGDALGGLLAGPLRHAGGDGDEVEGLGQAQHHGLHSVLQHTHTTSHHQPHSNILQQKDLTHTPVGNTQATRTLGVMLKEKKPSSSDAKICMKLILPHNGDRKKL